MKKVIIAHRWSGSPASDWYPWLKRELEQKGVGVVVLEMGDTEVPTIEEWAGNLAKAVGEQDSEVFIVAHSIGCQSAMRYLEKAEQPIGGAVFVAPWFHLKNLEDVEVEKIARPWIETPINFEKVGANISRLVCFFATNDPYGVADDAPLFKEHLGAETVVKNSGGHFTEDDGYTEFPEVRDALFKMMHI